MRSSWLPAKLHRHEASLARLAASVALVAVIVAAIPDQTDGIDAVLARPVSPGTLGLLLQYVRDTRAPARWMESLTHADPHVRATAARLLRVSTTPAALPALVRALATESDSATAPEIAGAVVSLGESSQDRAVLEAAKRSSANDLAIILATTRPEAATLE